MIETSRITSAGNETLPPEYLPDIVINWPFLYQLMVVGVPWSTTFNVTVVASRGLYMTVDALANNAPIKYHMYLMYQLRSMENMFLNNVVLYFEIISKPNKNLLSCLLDLSDKMNDRHKNGKKI